jgi:hypothetical protein
MKRIMVAVVYTAYTDYETDINMSELEDEIRDNFDDFYFQTQESYIDFEKEEVIIATKHLNINADGIVYLKKA